MNTGGWGGVGVTIHTVSSILLPISFYHCHYDISPAVIGSLYQIGTTVLEQVLKEFTINFEQIFHGIISLLV